MSPFPPFFDTSVPYPLIGLFFPPPQNSNKCGVSYHSPLFMPPLDGRREREVEGRGHAERRDGTRADRAAPPASPAPADRDVHVSQGDGAVPAALGHVEVSGAHF